MKRILLWDLETAMLVVEHPSGVIYQNQVGGNVTLQAELEGVVAPVEVFPDAMKQIEALDYRGGGIGISAETADALDAILDSQASTRTVRVDRSRLDESTEAWVYVTIDVPESDEISLTGPYFGPLVGFGPVKGVLTWPNSD